MISTYDPRGRRNLNYGNRRHWGNIQLPDNTNTTRFVRGLFVDFNHYNYDERLQSFKLQTFQQTCSKNLWFFFYFLLLLTFFKMFLILRQRRYLTFQICIFKRILNSLCPLVVTVTDKTSDQHGWLSAPLIGKNLNIVLSTW